MKYEEIVALARRLRKEQTPAEKVFWEKVRNRKFLGKKFYRQYIIEHEEVLGNKRFFIADFYCHQRRLIVELDGEVHLSQLEYDQYRENILQSMGFRVIRFKNEDVFNKWDFVSEVLVKSLCC